MTSIQSNTERQDDEIQVLQAIFTDDFVDLRKQNVWKTRIPPEIRLTLRPQLSMSSDLDNHTQVDLYLKCSTLYPDQIPEFRLENPKGITNYELSVLKDELENQVVTLVGEVLILDMAQTVQKFLHAHSRPAPKSFYEEMLSNKRRQEEKLALEQQKRNEMIKRKEDKERQLIEEEIAKRQTALKLEMKRKKEEEKQFDVIETLEIDGLATTHMSPIQPVPYRCTSLASDTSDGGKYGLSSTRRHRRTSTPMSVSEEEHECQCKEHKAGLQVLLFNSKGDRTVQRGKCLGHSENGSTVYAGLDTASGDVVAVTEWLLKWRHIAKKKREIIELDLEGNTYMKQVCSIEQEMMSLIKLRHKNLLHYLGMKSNREPGVITVHVLTEYSGGGCLDRYLKKKEALAIEKLKHYTKELLEALEYLHNKAVVHKNLRSSSVFEDANGKVRLADFSVNKRLAELYESVENARPGVHFCVSPQVVGRGGKKGDIYQLGIMLLSLAEGEKVTTIPPTIPTHLPQIFHDFLTKCIMNDERLRWSATQLQDHPFLKETILPPLPEKLPVKQKEVKKSIIEDDDEEEIPYITAFEASGLSRLTNEFEIMKSLGKGGFGDVLKVKNKLDGRIYAIKRIPLNPKSQHFTKKITREVKLLSRLNHENVVRYYNSWIETSDDPANSDTSSSAAGTSSAKTDSDKKTPSSDFTSRNSLGFIDNIENMAPPTKTDTSLEWTMNYSYSTSQLQKPFSESDSDSDDDNDDLRASFFPLFDEDSNSIIFGGDDEDDKFEDTSVISKKDNMKKETALDETDSLLDSGPKLQYLYIQMEYCEKSTLRNCIDAGLYEDVDRTWRLFREIIEGLIHLHDQGMIHRDLKPVNIFLDSNDHVKIGDFGLATTDILVKQSALLDASKQIGNVSDFYLSSSRSISLGDGNLTGNVGTALYVSPEVMASGGKLHYDQKVDIYSLGIIFFEMCYRPLPTGMERVTVLGNVRLPSIQLPSDFDEIEMANQTCIIRSLLNHDPSCRPTSKELLQSDHLPPPQMEEAELNEILRSTISNPQSKSYRRMIDAMFSQPVPLIQHLTYDNDLYKGVLTTKAALVQTSVHGTIERIFQRHGALRMSTPILMPKCFLYQDEQYACFMDHSGNVVGLRCDLRVPFARYVAKSHIQSLKRYCIDHVYQEKKLFGLHPKEMTECAFDIITPYQFGLIPESELLAVVGEVVNEFPALQERNYYFRINHTCLLKSVLVYCGIPEDKQQSVLLCLRDFQHKKAERRQNLESSCGVTFNEHTAAMFFTLLDYEGTYKNINSLLRSLTKSKGEAGTLVKRALHELEAVIIYAEALGVKLEIKVTVGLIYNPLQYSGIIFQLMYEHRKKKRLVTDVLAAGGRYDQLINHFHRSSKLDKDSGIGESSPCGVGVSMAFEKIVAAVMENLEENPCSHDIVVCSVGHNPMWKERLNIVKDLWSAGLRAEVLYDSIQSLEDVQLYCQNLHIPFIVYLKDGDGGFVRIRWVEREKTMEKKVRIPETVTMLQDKLQAITKSDVNDANPVVSRGTCNTNTSIEGNQISSINVPSFNFHFVNENNKLPVNTRRRYESQIFAKVCSVLPWLPGKSLDVIAINVDYTTLKIIAAYLEINEDENAFNKSISVVLDKQQRNKKYLVKILDQIYELKFEKKCCYFVIYGMKDDSMKLMT
ncbi:eIF-2-alpha kinase GCN2-like isoform X1 [Patella vulgata]|uniref:eIF-2-alpha kinase GCN2-like isoform X1 n=1 Tax=Patella vulgata TaxID=6465 RepID=UPI0024A8E380|nr:eIF-2-alpha kinase GCN2-like isoform X1 [Patella vulgata]